MPLESSTSVAAAPSAPAAEEQATPAIPDTLGILPLEHFILFPSMIAPILVGDEGSKKLVDEALAGKRLIAVMTKRPEAATLTEFASLYEVGTLASILKMLKMPDGTVRLLLHGQERIRLQERLQESPYLCGAFVPEPDLARESTSIEPLMKNVYSQLDRAIGISDMPADLRVAAENLSDGGKLADLIASNLNLKVSEQQEVLETRNVYERLEKVLYMLNREVEVLELGNRIQSQVKTEMDKNQREYLLREQMKAIQKELNEEGEAAGELGPLAEQLAAKPLPEAAREVARKELSRLRAMQPSSAEYGMMRGYLETILELPWLESSRDRLDLRRAKSILDRDHFGIERVKDRILEYLAVRKLKKDMRGPILCLTGPPGVGKTTLARSIADALGRQFHRISLGGVRDEAEIRGHRRTYVGAMPGRLIKAYKSTKTNNPVVLLDEIDKLGSDFRGDPASALLEVLDPAQNTAFNDHYLEIQFDLSKTLFITTANQLEPIPGPLRDRMEVVELAGYTAHEKLEIARRHIVPKQLKENGLTPPQISFQEEALLKIIHDYTREAGLRNLERQVGAICRKVARAVATRELRRDRITPDRVVELLGPERFHNETAARTSVPGVAVGLAWTPVGGEILFVESTLTRGSGRFILTGQIGEVMRESAQAAMTYIHSQASTMRIPEELFAKRDVHMHVPAGAIPKDGPSAGITIATAVASLLTGRLVKDFIAMTGEITLKGNVLPVGGVKEKVLAAHRAGIQEVILPERNQPDIAQFPEEVRQKITFHCVSHVDDVLKLALMPKRVSNAARHQLLTTGKGAAVPRARHGQGSGGGAPIEVPVGADIDAPAQVARGGSKTKRIQADGSTSKSAEGRLRQKSNKYPTGRGNATASIRQIPLSKPTRAAKR